MIQDAMHVNQQEVSLALKVGSNRLCQFPWFALELGGIRGNAALQTRIVSLLTALIKEEVVLSPPDDPLPPYATATPSTHPCSIYLHHGMKEQRFKPPAGKNKSGYYRGTSLIRNFNPPRTTKGP